MKYSEMPLEVKFVNYLRVYLLDYKLEITRATNQGKLLYFTALLNSNNVPVNCPSAGTEPMRIWEDGMWEENLKHQNLHYFNYKWYIDRKWSGCS